MTRGALDSPVFLPADPLTSDEVQRVDDGAGGEFEDAGQNESPLLDFGDPREDEYVSDSRRCGFASFAP